MRHALRKHSPRTPKLHPGSPWGLLRVTTAFHSGVFHLVSLLSPVSLTCEVGLCGYKETEVTLHSIKLGFGGITRNTKSEQTNRHSTNIGPGFM